MQNLILNPKDNEVVVIKDKNSNYTINIKENTHVQILEYDILNSQVNLNVAKYGNAKYDVLNVSTSNVKRHFVLNKNAEVKMNTVNLSVLTDNTVVDLDGDYARYDVENLAIISGGNQIVKTTTNHNAHNGVSKVYNIGVAIENAEILFDTTGAVQKDMEINDCRQLSKGIVIGENAKITERPILLIDNYNVSAYHGASIGKMSEEQLFYLMSRGISKKDAFMLILNGLIAPFLANIADEAKKAEADMAIKSLLEEAE
ncbi:MAG: SufD family Fe-S cluster assembly protein [Acholeplasmatales bacterium]|nr:SufD family Fe-S cluster assembly protein [Acholeplasmatales bacterium]